MDSNNRSIIDFFRTSVFKVILYFIVSNLTIGAFLYFFHIEGQHKRLFEEISNKAQTVGSSIETLLNKASKAGVPINKMHGKTDYLDQKMTETRELKYIFITDLEGNILGKNSNAPDTLRGTLKNFSEDYDIAAPKVISFQAFSSYNIAVPILEQVAQTKETNVAAQNMQQQLVGFVHLGVSTESVQNSISDIFFDIAIILFVSIIIGYEFLKFTFLNYVITPVEDLLSTVTRIAKGYIQYTGSIRADTELYNNLKKLNFIVSDYSFKFYNILKDFTKISDMNPLYSLISDTISELKTRLYIQPNGMPLLMPLAPAVENIRIIIFLWMISEGIVTAILPGYVSQFYLSSYVISKQLFSAMPVILFLLCAMITLPFGPMLIKRIGFRKSLLSVLTVYMMSYFMLSVFSQSYIMIQLCRMVAGASFGAIFIIIQNYVSTYSTDETRVKNFSIYSIANGSAYLCGIPVGGLLIDNVGYAATCMLCVVMACGAILCTYLFLVEYKGFSIKKSAVKIVSPLDVNFIPGLSWIIICLAFPPRLLVISTVSFLDPMLLASLGNSYSVIGRILMIYGIMLFCISPYAYKILHIFKSAKHAIFVAFFLLIVSLCVQAYSLSTQGTVIALFFFSLGVILHTSSIYSYLNHIGKAQEDVNNREKIIALYFTYERIAFLLGPILSSVCIAAYGYQLTLAASASILIIALSVYIYIHYSKIGLRFLEKKGVPNL